MQSNEVRFSMLPLFEEQSPEQVMRVAQEKLEELVRGMPPSERQRLWRAVGRAATLASNLAQRNVVGFNVSYDALRGDHFAFLLDPNLLMIPESFERIDPVTAELFFRALALELHRMPGVGQSAMLVSRRQVVTPSGKATLAQVRWELIQVVTPQGSGFHIYMRKQTPQRVFTLEELHRQGTIDSSAMDVVRQILKSDEIPSIFVVGGPATGKTTILNALLLELYRGVLQRQVVVAVGEASDFVVPPEVQTPSGRSHPSAILTVFLPGQAEWESIGDAIRRCNAMCAIIGEITSETAPLVVLAMQAFAAVFGTMHTTLEGFLAGIWREIGMTGDVSSIAAMLRACYLIETRIRIARDDPRNPFRRYLARIARLTNGRLEILYSSPAPSAIQASSMAQGQMRR